MYTMLCEEVFSVREIVFFDETEPEDGPSRKERVQAFHHCLESVLVAPRIVRVLTAPCSPPMDPCTSRPVLHKRSAAAMAADIPVPVVKYNLVRTISLPSVTTPEAAVGDLAPAMELDDTADTAASAVVDAMFTAEEVSHIPTVVRMFSTFSHF